MQHLLNTDRVHIAAQTSPSYRVKKNKTNLATRVLSQLTNRAKVLLPQLNTTMWTEFAFEPAPNCLIASLTTPNSIGYQS